MLAIHGLSQTGWIWAPIARRLGGPAGSRRFVSMDLRGHGLSDAPTDDGAYDLAVLASDVEAVAEGSGLLAADREAGPGVVLAGHGFGAIVAATAAVELGARCAGLVLVDGGWESLEASTGVDVDEFLRGLDEPPEVMRSLPAFLRRPLAVRSGDRGTRTRTGGPSHGRGDARRSGRPGDPAARPRGLRPRDVHVRPGRDAGRRRRPDHRPGRHRR